METIGQTLDPFCIVLYQWTGVWTGVPPILDSFLGTLLLALLCVVIGEFTSSIAYLTNRKYLKGIQREMIQMHDLSMEAIGKKDKASYKAFNKQATEAYGKLFFNTTIFSAVFLWPAFFALGWIQYRFFEVELPLPLSLPIFGKSVGYTFVFILCYILNRILFQNIRERFPTFGMFKPFLMRLKKILARQ